ncbi:MAG TPA: cytochrome c biogenesis protein CcsA [Pyrinomonadaceae bacterium]|jgi:ABC-type transport system involved in cytochrome c biogenesis permease subunit|nr:cytochrome c biogenesis protein CcsA [Pyrinomonadaceae bacterium]
MSEVLGSNEILTDSATVGAPKHEDGSVWSFKSYLPAIIPIVGALLMVLLRIQMGGERFMTDGALMMIALACYLTAATFHLTNLYAPSDMAQKIGLWTGCLGVFFNLSSWCVRWVAGYDRELQIFQAQGKSAADMEWAFRYIPFANLYDLSLAFAFGAGITTMVISGRKNFRFIGAISLPLAALILVLARFIGNEFINLPPVLDSYWRPIHVGIASLSYGVALVCFAAAVIYLLKVGTKPESMAIWAAIFGLGVFATVSRFSVFTTGIYTASTFMQGSRMALPLRADIPYVGLLIVISGVLLLGVIALFGKYLLQEDARARTWGHWLLKLSLVTQACAILALVSQVKSMTNVVSKINPKQYPQFGAWLAEQQGMTAEQVRAIDPARFVAASQEFVTERGSSLILSLNANPVELSALITAFAATLFVVFFSFRTDVLRKALPSAEKLDSLMYKTASVAFAGLAMLLVTGAIWANESWGRYWGWDSKETGAFVAWLTYGGFLHARIARGMTGKRSAYFAVVAFLLVIFTYLGVSYLLPGLHSYA